MADKDDDLDILVRPEPPPPAVRKPLSAANFGVSPVPDEVKSQPATVAAQTPATALPAALVAAAPASKAASVATTSTGSTTAAIEAGALMVGRQVSFIGEINACKRLVVEGSVDAKLQGCETIEVAETGLLQGDVRTDNAEVHGRVEGELVVKGRLTIKQKGQVTGTVTYGEIEIERGGRIVGGMTARDGATDRWA